LGTVYEGLRNQIIGHSLPLYKTATFDLYILDNVSVEIVTMGHSTLSCELTDSIFTPILDLLCVIPVEGSAYWILASEMFLFTAPILAVLLTVRSNAEKIDKVSNESNLSNVEDEGSSREAENDNYFNQGNTNFNVDDPYIPHQHYIEDDFSQDTLESQTIHQEEYFSP
jgi:hypothetical protein